MMNNETPADPSDDFIAILGTRPSGPQAGYPQITIPMGYNATHAADAERLGPRQRLQRAQPDRRRLRDRAGHASCASRRQQLNPSMYRCAKTVPAPPFAARGGCNPDYDATMELVGGTAPTLPFSLETESAQSLQDAA